MPVAYYLEYVAYLALYSLHMQVVPMQDVASAQLISVLLMIAEMMSLNMVV